MIDKDQKRWFARSLESSRLTNMLLGILVLIASGVILHQLQVIFKPLFIAIFITFVFEPLVELFTRIKVPKFLAFILSIIIVFTVLVLIGLIIYSSFASFTNEFPKYQDKFVGLYKNVIGLLKIPHEEVQTYFEQIKWTQLWKSVSVTSFLGSTVGTFITFLSNLFIVLLLTVYITLGKSHYMGKIDRAFDDEDSLRVTRIVGNINRGMQRYLVAKMMISLGTGIIATLILLAFGVEFALIWGLLTFLLNFIPNIGSIIATIPPILVAFFQFSSWVPGVWVAVLLLTTQVSMGNLVEPRVMGKSLHISPLVVIFSLIFWGYIWGPIGMVLAVPISSSIQIICTNIDSLKPISVFMGGE